VIVERRKQSCQLRSGFRAQRNSACRRTARGLCDMVEKRFFVLRYRWLRFVQNVQNVKGNRVVGGDDLEFVTRKEPNALTSPDSPELALAL